MKYIKYFDNDNIDDEYWNEGDYITCIDITNCDSDHISINSTYVIKGFKITNDKLFVNIIDDTNNLNFFYIKRFIPASDEDIINYKIKQDSKKYNL